MPQYEPKFYFNLSKPFMVYAVRREKEKDAMSKKCVLVRMSELR